LHGSELATNAIFWRFGLPSFRFLPQIEDNTKRISKLAVLALTPPMNDFTSAREQIFPCSFQIIDKQRHYQTANFITFDDNQIEKIRIVVAES
jgi:hypothetical protein